MNNKVTIPKGVHVETAAGVDTGILALTMAEVTDFPKHLQVEETHHILQWARSLRDDAGGTAWVSYHQLLVDYQQQTGRIGPYTHGNKWTARGIDVMYDYPRQVQMFGRFLQNLAKGIKHPLQTDQRRPASTAGFLEWMPTCGDH